MNGPTWVYRLKIWHPPINSDADIDVSYGFSSTEAFRLRDLWRARGVSAEVSSATVGNFFVLKKWGEE